MTQLEDEGSLFGSDDDDGSWEDTVMEVTPPPTMANGVARTNAVTNPGGSPTGTQASARPFLEEGGEGEVETIMETPLYKHVAKGNSGQQNQDLSEKNGSFAKKQSFPNGGEGMEEPFETKVDTSLAKPFPDKEDQVSEEEDDEDDSVLGPSDEWNTKHDLEKDGSQREPSFTHGGSMEEGIEATMMDTALSMQFPKGENSCEEEEGDEEGGGDEDDSVLATSYQKITRSTQDLADKVGLIEGSTHTETAFSTEDSEGKDIDGWVEPPTESVKKESEPNDQTHEYHIGFAKTRDQESASMQSDSKTGSVYEGPFFGNHKSLSIGSNTTNRISVKEIPSPPLVMSPDKSSVVRDGYSLQEPNPEGQEARDVTDVAASSKKKAEPIPSKTLPNREDKTNETALKSRQQMKPLLAHGPGSVGRGAGGLPREDKTVWPPLSSSERKSGKEEILSSQRGEGSTTPLTNAMNPAFPHGSLLDKVESTVAGPSVVLGTVNVGGEGHCPGSKGLKARRTAPSVDPIVSSHGLTKDIRVVSNKQMNEEARPHYDDFGDSAGLASVGRKWAWETPSPSSATMDLQDQEDDIPEHFIISDTEADRARTLDTGCERLEEREQSHHRTKAVGSTIDNLKQDAPDHKAYTAVSKPTNDVDEDDENSCAGCWSESDSELSIDEEHDNNEGTQQALSFNVGWLGDCMKNGEAALDEIHNKNVVLVMGKTGAGKTCFINGIAQKEIEQAVVNHTSSGMTVEKQVFVVKDELPGFKIGHSKKSMTKCIRCFAPGGKTVYVDAPGHEDTDGPEVDIATSVMINQVVKRCKSIRFVLLINYTSLLEDRGGSLRALLKTINLFVDDFKANKTSFTFLFTHLNEIKEVPEDLPGARESLLKELIRTKAGTNKRETEVLQILNHMIDYLKKRGYDPDKRRYKIVDVLHPMKSDFAELKEIVEESKAVTKKFIAGNCGLTPQLLLRLTAGLESMLQRIRWQLKNDSSSAEAKEAMELCENVEFLKKFVDIEVVHTKVAECSSVVAAYTKSLSGVVEMETQRGTSVDSKFCASNVEILKNTLDQLKVFNKFAENGRSVGELESFIDRKVRNYQTHAVNEDGIAFEHLHVVLNNLYFWSEGFGEFATLYKETRSHLVRQLRSCCNTIAKFDLMDPTSSSREVIQSFVEAVRMLELVCKLNTRLSEHTINISLARKTLDESRRKIIEAVHGLGCTSELTTEDDLVVAARHVCTLKHLQELTESRLDEIPGLSDASSKRLDQMGESVLNFCSKKFTQYEKKRANVDARWHDRIRRLHDTVTLFDDLKGEYWEQIRTGYKSMMLSIGFVLEARIKTLTLSANEIRENGFREGCHKFRSAIANVAGCDWLDNYLPPDRCFVVFSLSELRKIYQERIDVVVHMANLHLSKLTDDTNEWSQASKLLKDSIFPELKQVSQLDRSYAHYESSALAQLLDQVKVNTTRTSELLHSWTDTAKQWKIDLNTPRAANMNRQQQLLSEAGFAVDASLGKLKSLFEICPKLNSTDKQGILKETCEGFQTFAQSLEVVVGCKGRYLAKYHALSLAEELARYRHIPLKGLDRLKTKAKTSVEKHATYVQKLIGENSVHQDVENEMRMFAKSPLIDRFTSNEGSTSLVSLQRLLVQKEEGLDSQLQDLIQANDCQGVVDLLQSNIYPKGHRSLPKLKTLVSSMMLDIVEKARCEMHLPNLDREIIQRVTRRMESLELARIKLSEYAVHGGLYLPREISALKKLINEIARKNIEQMKLASKRMDFVGLGVGQLNISAFLNSSILGFLEKGVAVDMHGALALFQKAVDSVSQHSALFVSSCLTEGSCLIGDLISLKHAHDHNSPKLGELALKYQETSRALSMQLNEKYHAIATAVVERQCFDEAIAWILALQHQLNLGLQDHIKLDFDFTAQLHEWRSQKRDYDKDLEFEGFDAASTLDKWSRSLNKLDPQSKWWIPGFLKNERDSSYMRLCKNLEAEIQRIFSSGEAAILRTKDLETAQEKIAMLDLVSSKVGKHVSKSIQSRDELQKIALDSFIQLCDDAQQALESGSTNEFKRLLPEYRNFVLQIPLTMRSPRGKAAFSSTNQKVFETADKLITDMKELVNSFDFRKIKETVEHMRKHWGYIADRFALLHEEVECSHHANVDRSLEELRKLCYANFSNGRRLDLIKHFAVLELSPSASQTEVVHSYKLKKDRALSKNNDTAGGCRNEAELRVILRNLEIAYTELTKDENTVIPSAAQPFDDIIRSLGDRLREKARHLLRQQRYDLVEQLLFKLGGLHVLDDIVRPSLESTTIVNTISDLVKQHVDGVRIDVETNWAERKYKSVNENIADLKQMEASFKSYSDIFPTSWNTRVFSAVESEIENFGARARGFLVSKATAYQKLTDFRRWFVSMGFVLDELVWFKDFTKTIMNSVLEACLNVDWGHGFLFDLGLSLQRGDANADDDENRICQMIVAEFSHFREVQTMVWNEETCQKPADDTVHDIRGEQRSSSGTKELDIDQQELLTKFWSFEEKYKQYLAEYLHEDAAVNELVQTVVKYANSLKPIECDGGWTTEVKEHLPSILAGVFAVFTVLKSSATYNRIGNDKLGEKILMKPHNIQVLTILSMFGCGDPTSSNLENQVMQIRTGEGKSLILGAAAVVLALFGFRVRCVCYSEYLSNRDFELFKDLFGYFQLADRITYSKITKLSEDCTRTKGDIRNLTESLLKGSLSSRGCKTGKNEQGRLDEEILVVDEFDVFFGSDFYGQTYNQVYQLQEDEIAEILRFIWTNSKRVGQKLKLADIQGIESYQHLVKKYPDFTYLFDNEILLMIDQVKRVDEEPYHLDEVTGRIGYKVMDTIEYDVTYGYCTMFAYLKEADKGKLQNAETRLANVLAMPVSCGQFSYASISPLRILGVSGTVAAMGQYEHDVLAKYGIERFIYVPSVYGKSNFDFDKAGDGIFVEPSVSDFFHKITDVILDVTKQRRAAIVFFHDNLRLQEYKRSSFFKKFDRRQVRLLTEDMSANDKEFVVKKAATAGQTTLCTASFGRGTDFFCKDDVVHKNGGVHVVQAFLSEALSEELQIRGRTSRQGKEGSYQMVLLESDLKTHFGVEIGAKDTVAKKDMYEWLSSARAKKHESHCHVMDVNLQDATEKDQNTNLYFDALIQGDSRKAQDLFKELYFSMKTQALAANTDIDIAFLIDVTGSMGPYKSAIAATIHTLIDKRGAVMGRLQANYPDTEFTFRTAVMAFRDIDDEAKQFTESTWHSKSHFTDSADEAIRFVERNTKHSSGGGDLAEDILGALDRCAHWSGPGDWASRLKFIMVLTDAAAHGLTDPGFASGQNSDNYSSRHPLGLTVDSVVDGLVSKGIDLFMCSFNPASTLKTEQELSQTYRDHPRNKDQREVTTIPLVPTSKHPGAHDPSVNYDRHIIFVLDQSGSMYDDWSGVVIAYNQYIARRQQYQCESDLVSVVQFSHEAEVTVSLSPIGSAPKDLYYHDGGTNFSPAALSAYNVAKASPSTHVPVIVFMSDGCANDAPQAASHFSDLNNDIKALTGSDLELHVIAFSPYADQSQLGQIAAASPIGKVKASTDTSDLAKVFQEIAGGANVAGLLEAEIGKRVSEAVGNKLALEFM